jgi:hypothetical protein
LVVESAESIAKTVESVSFALTLVVSGGISLLERARKASVAPMMDYAVSAAFISY